MEGLKRRASQVWPEEHGEQEHGLYSLHRMFDIVGTHLTHRDVRVPDPIMNTHTASLVGAAE